MSLRDLYLVGNRCLPEYRQHFHFDNSRLGHGYESTCPSLGLPVKGIHVIATERQHQNSGTREGYSKGNTENEQ